LHIGTENKAAFNVIADLVPTRANIDIISIVSEDIQHVAGTGQVQDFTIVKNQRIVPTKYHIGLADI
jgi:hypothetical protein